MNREGEIKNQEACLKNIMPFLEMNNTISEIKTKWETYIATYMREIVKSEKNYKQNSRGKDRKYMKNLKRN